MSIYTACIFWSVAIIASSLYGWHAVAIHSPPKTTANPCPISNYPKAWWWHQRWLNFLGSMVGWTALWYIFRHFNTCLFCSCSDQFEARDVITSLIAFAGITGFLPGILVSSFLAFSGLSAKLTEILASWVTKLK